MASSHALLVQRSPRGTCQSREVVARCCAQLCHGSDLQKQCCPQKKRSMSLWGPDPTEASPVEMEVPGFESGQSHPALLLGPSTAALTASCAGPLCRHPSSCWAPAPFSVWRSCSWAGLGWAALVALQVPICQGLCVVPKASLPPVRLLADSWLCVSAGGLCCLKSQASALQEGLVLRSHFSFCRCSLVSFASGCSASPPTPAYLGLFFYLIT